MYLADFHTHSMCSIDSETPLIHMVQAAHRAGIQEMCTTDHYDMYTIEGDIAPRLDWGEILAQYEKTLPLCPADFKLRLGIELGSAQRDPALAESIVMDAPLDFVIGSIHNMGSDFGHKDLYFIDLSDIDYCHAIAADYLDRMLELAPLSCYDTMGHVIYPFRYMPPMGKDYFEPQYYDKFRTLLTTIVETGHGIELNTVRSQDIAAWKPVMELYRDCGGEIVTLGSDGHSPEQVGVGIREAQELIRSVGFRYQTTFQNRKASFIKL